VCRVGGLHPHQDGFLAGRLGVGQRFLHVSDIGNCIAAYIKDDIAGIDAAGHIETT